MQQEIESLVQAIESLRQESNPFKDYVFPIASALFTSLLGAGVAYFTLKYNETIQIEKDKMNITNKWTFLVEGARANLIAIKINYHGNLTTIPAQRMAAIPFILLSASPILEKYEQLSFIIPKKDSPKVNQPKCLEILLIRSMVHNYNHILELWEQRNKIDRPIKEKIINTHSKNTSSYANIGHNEILDCIGSVDLSIIIDLTERVVKLTDDILIELDNFLLEFPKYAETLINTNKLKKYGSIFKHSNSDNELLLEILKKSPEADYSTVEELFGQTSSQIKARHKTGYEN